MLHRVLVTGLGMVTPTGKSVAENWNTIAVKGLGGITRVRELRIDGASHGIARAEDVVRFPCGMVELSNQELKEKLTLNKAQQSRFIALTLYAAEEALRDAGLPSASGTDNAATIMYENAACVIGCSMGGFTGEDTTTTTTRSLTRLSPFFIPRILPNMAAGHLSMRYGFKGPITCPSTACASGAHAIGDAFRMIQRGEVDLAICGGTESVMDDIAFAGFHRMKALRVLSKEEASREGVDAVSTACCPFDDRRDGFVMGEGCGLVVLESERHASARGVKRVYGEVLGYGMSGDAHHITSPPPGGEGAELAMRRALRDSHSRVKGDASAHAMVYLNAHATSTPAGDAAEARAISRVFASHSPRDDEIVPLVSSTKGFTAHLLGAAGAVEFGLTVLALKEGVAFRNMNLEEAGEIRSFLGNALVAGISRANGVRSHAEGEAQRGARSEGGDGGDQGVVMRGVVKNVSIGKRRRVAMSNSFGFGGTNVSLVVGEV